MIFSPLDLEGAYAIDVERQSDTRGYFARTYCATKFAALGLNTEWAQCGASFNRHKGTVRGLHYQAAPFSEIKLIRCTRGAVFDVVVDIRPRSATFGHWQGLELSAENARLVYVPEGFAHGFQTLTDDAELFYQISTPYRPEASAGIRFDDPALGIRWPLPVSCLSERDARLPLLETAAC
jgi:dTDP-4-dehydrorhamnose 3,5-epimerase